MSFRNSSLRSTLLETAEGEKTLPSYQRLETVLIVEDEQDLNQALSLRLRAAGLNVASAFDGIAGLEKAALLEPDLIVLDLGLPRLHGYKLLESLRKEGKIHEAPILVITGDPSPNLETSARHWGIHRVFRKPLRLRSLVSEILLTLRRY